MIYKYLEIPYDSKKELMPQLNDICKKYPGTRFHSMGQKINPNVKLTDAQGRMLPPQVQIVLIMECIYPENES